jgi:hypothetical protein
VGEKEQTFLFSGRHVLPILLVSIYWVGAGVITIYDWTLKKVDSLSVFPGLGPRKRSATVWVTLLILILAIVLPKTLKAQRYERLPEKWSGIWIRNQSGQGATIFTDLPRVAYYAGGKSVSVDLERESIDQIKTSMVEKNASIWSLRKEVQFTCLRRTRPSERILLKPFDTGRRRWKTSLFMRGFSNLSTLLCRYQKGEKVLGDDPIVTMEEGLKKTVAYFQKLRPPLSADRG